MTENQYIPDIFKKATLGTEVQTENLEKRADQVIHDLTNTFLVGAKENISRLKELISVLQTQSQPAVAKKELYQTAHDLKGQGSVFGYNLITALGSDICKILQKNNILSNEELDIVEQDIADMALVLTFPPHTQNETLRHIQKRLDNKS